MINPFRDINWQPDVAERRKFAISLMIGFPALAAIWQVVGLALGTGWSGTLAWVAGGGFALGVLLWLVPQISKPVYLIWYFLAACIGLVISNLLLGAFYYLVLTPVGLVMRLFGRDLMRRKFDRSAPTYWDPVDPAADLQRYYRQY